MPQPLIAGLPPDLILSAGYIVRVVALDPSTGATVSGVALTDVSLFVSDLNDSIQDDQTNPLLVPSNVTV